MQSPLPARRSFLGRIAGAAAMLGLGPVAARAETLGGTADEPWLAPLASAKHKQVFDAPEANGGFPMIFATTYLDTMKEAYGLGPKDAHAVVVLRHFAAVLGMTDEIWAKYRIGAAMKIDDPATKAPAVRNFYVNSKAGDMMRPQFSVDRVIALGVTVCICNKAIGALSGMMAAGAGMKPEEAAAEWRKGVVPGAYVVPSGVMAVGRTQESGATYCFAS